MNYYRQTLLSLSIKKLKDVNISIGLNNVTVTWTGATKVPCNEILAHDCLLQFSVVECQLPVHTPFVLAADLAFR